MSNQLGVNGPVTLLFRIASYFVMGNMVRAGIVSVKGTVFHCKAWYTAWTLYSTESQPEHLKPNNGVIALSALSPKKVY
jgi:hypothetical protein